MSASSFFLLIGFEKTFGSNDGCEPSASTSPFCTFITAKAPLPVPPASACWATRCTFRSSDSRSCWPCSGCTRFSVFVSLPSASTSTRAAPLRPRR